MAFESTGIESVLMSLARAAEPSGTAWLWQYESQHFLERRVPDLLEALSRHEKLKVPIAATIRRLVDRDRLDVPAAVLRHHFFAYGLYDWQARSEYGTYTVFSAGEVEKLATGVGETVVRWVNSDIPRLRTIISGQVIFLAKDLGLWGENERQILSRLFYEEEALLAIMLWFYDPDGMTERATLRKLVDEELFINKLKELERSERFAELNAETKVSFQKALSEDFP